MTKVIVQVAIFDRGGCTKSPPTFKISHAQGKHTPPRIVYSVYIVYIDNRAPRTNPARTGGGTGQ